MIKCGTDIVEISRIIESIKNPIFLSRVFAPVELKYFAENSFNPSSIAVNFCAKEAFSKALGTGIRGFSLNEVAILRDGLGAPYFIFEGNAKKIVKEQQLKFSVSLSHSNEYATAVVIAYRD